MAKSSNSYRTWIVMVLMTLVSITFIRWIVEEEKIPEIEATKGTNSKFNKTVKAEKLISDSIKEAISTLNLIHQRYELHYIPWREFFTMIWNIDEIGWEMIRLKFTIKLLRSMLANQITKDNPQFFSMIFTGSSVTAGYDIYYNQSYPSIIENRFSSFFQTLHLPIQLENYAQSRVHCHLLNYCFPSMAQLQKEDSIDLFFWEHSYACGKDERNIEYFTRLAASYQAIPHFSASGGPNFAHCPPHNPSIGRIPYISDEWSPNLDPAIAANNKYNPATSEDLAIFKQDLFMMYARSQSVKKLVSGVKKYYSKATAANRQQRKLAATTTSSKNSQDKGKNSINKAKGEISQHVGVLPPLHGFSFWSEYIGRECNLTAVQPRRRQRQPQDKQQQSTNKKRWLQAAAEEDQDLDQQTTAADEAFIRTVQAYQQKQQAQEQQQAGRAGITKKLPSSSSKKQPQPAASTINYNLKCIAAQLFANMCQSMGGPHYMVSEGNLRYYNQDNKGNMDGMGDAKSWHPSRGMHLLRGEVIVYYYLHIFLDSLYHLQDDLEHYDEVIDGWLQEKQSQRAEKEGAQGDPAGQSQRQSNRKSSSSSSSKRQQQVRKSNRLQEMTEDEMKDLIKYFEDKLATYYPFSPEQGISSIPPKFCHPWECGFPLHSDSNGTSSSVNSTNFLAPTCYTDYGPQYSHRKTAAAVDGNKEREDKKYSLESILVGPRVNSHLYGYIYKQWSSPRDYDQLGLLDTKQYYLFDTISVLISNVRFGIAKLYPFNERYPLSPSELTIYLDPFIAWKGPSSSSLLSLQQTVYKPSSRQYILLNVTLIPTESNHLHIQHIPITTTSEQYHVLTITVDGTKKKAKKMVTQDYQASLSHVVIF